MAKFRVETELGVKSDGRAKGAFAAITKDAKQANKDVGDLKRTAIGLVTAFGTIHLAMAPWKAFQGVIRDSIKESEAATRSMKQIESAAAGLHRTIGDQIAPGLQQAATAISNSLANPALQKGIQDTGRIIGFMAAAVGELASEVIDFAASPAFQKFLDFVYADERATLNSDAWKAVEEHNRTVNQIVTAVDKWRSGVKEQIAEEKKAAAERERLHQQHLKNLQAILDKADPVAAAERETAAAIATLNKALREGDVDIKAYQRALAMLTAELRAIQGITGTVAANLELPMLEVSSQLSARMAELSSEALRHGIQAAGEQQPLEIQIAPGWEQQLEDDIAAINKTFGQGLARSLMSASDAFIADLISGSDDAFDNLKENLTKALLQSVAEWLTNMLAAIAKAAIASKAISGGTGAGGGGGFMSSLGSMFGGSGGAAISGGTLAAIAGFAAVAAVAAWSKHQQSKIEGAKYGTSAGAFFDGSGTMTAEWAGKLNQTGKAVSDALGGLLNSLQQTTGAFITGVHQATVKIRNDKKWFEAEVDGVVIGAFRSAEEAVLAAAKTLFANASLSRALDPAIQQILTNFDPALGIEKLVDTVAKVQGILNEVSGLSEIEIALQNLPQQAAALTSELQGLGVTLVDSTRIASQWTVNQLQNLRDAITGRQRTQAEELAERQRQAAMFNAQLALMKAETLMKRDEVARDLAVLEAKGQVMQSGAAVARADLQIQQAYVEGRAEILGTMADVYDGELTLIQQFGNAAIEAVRAQLEALNLVLASLEQIQPIDLAEIRIPNVGGVGGGNLGGVSGPSPAEVAAQDLANLWNQIRQIFEGLSTDYSIKLEQLKRAMYEQIELAHDDADALAAINQAYEAQIAALQNEALTSLGLQSVAIAEQFRQLGQTLAFLADQGAITQAQLTELGNQMFLDLASGLLQYVENEEVRRQLEDLRFQMEMANYQLQFEALQALNLLTEAQIATIEGLLTGIWDAYENGDLDFQQINLPTPQAQTGGQTGPDPLEAAMRALTQALDRLRAAQERMQQVRDSLVSGALSPLTTEQQFNQAQQAYFDMLAAAQGGDVAAIEGLGDAAALYLELASQMFDTGSAGYAGIAATVDGQLAGMQSAIDAIIAAAPTQNEGVEIRLDTIAQILQQIAATGGIPPTWNPNATPAGGNLWSPNLSGGNQTPLLGSMGNALFGNFGQQFAATAGPVHVVAPELEHRLDAVEKKLGTGNALQKMGINQAKADSLKVARPAAAGFSARAAAGNR